MKILEMSKINAGCKLQADSSFNFNSIELINEGYNIKGLNVQNLLIYSISIRHYNDKHSR